MKYGENVSLMCYIKDFDYVGIVLYIGSFLVFMMGFNWGGGVYLWKLGYVIGSIVLGFIGFVFFVLWEFFVKFKEFFVLMYFFKNGFWVVVIILLGFGVSVYYVLVIVWFSMVVVLYNDGGVMINVWYLFFVGFWIIVG